MFQQGKIYCRIRAESNVEGIALVLAKQTFLSMTGIAMVSGDGSSSSMISHLFFKECSYICMSWKIEFNILIWIELCDISCF